MTLIYLTIVAVFFPVPIRFLGRDAISTGTIFIFILFIKYLFDSFNERKFIKEKYDLLVYLLIFLGAVSICSPIVTGMLSGEQIGRAVRQYVGFLGAMLLFVVIKNYRPKIFQSDNESNNNLHVEGLLSLFLILISIHILISIAVKFFPFLGSVFDIFLSRNVEVFDSVDRGQLQRINSFVFGYEGYGEILAALTPIVIYKIYRFKNPFWIVCLLLFSVGLIFSVTRSGILLFMTGVSLSLLYFFKNNLGKTFLLTSIALMSSFLIVSWDISLLGDVFQRFNDATETYAYTGSFIKTINRGKVFYESWELVVSNLTLFGNGITEFHFHNLYLSTIYQKGIIGLMLFIVVILVPLVKLIKTIKSDMYKNKELVFMCLLSLILFFINEAKFEFTRGSSYQQIWWGILGTYYLVSKDKMQRTI